MRMMAKFILPLLVFFLFLVAGLLIFTDPFGWTGRTTHVAPPSANAQASEDVQPTVAFEPLTAEVPPLCGHPGGRLVDGALPKDPSRMGDTYAKKYPTGEIMWAVLERPLKQTDTVTSVLAVGCNKGGVSWPDTILAYNRSAELVGYVTLDAVTGGSREAIRSLGVADGIVVASWTTEAEGDLACCGTILASSNFTLDEPRLVDGGVTVTNEENSLRSLLKATNEGDVTSATKFFEAETAKALISAWDSEGNIRLHKCYGLLNSREMPIAALSLFKQGDASGNVVLPPSDGIVRLCVVITESNKTFVLGYAQPNTAQWIIRLVLG